MFGIVVTALVGDEAEFAVVVLCAEAESEEIRRRTVGFNDITVRVVDVLRGEGAGFGDVADDVRVVAVEGEIEGAVDGNGEQPFDSARALLGAGAVGAPVVFAGAG